MTARDIFEATRGATSCGVSSISDQALLAMCDLVVSFLVATDEGCPESMKAMSIDQIRLLNQLHLAVGR